MHFTYHNKCNNTVKVFIASNRGFVDYIIFAADCYTKGNNQFNTNTAYRKSFNIKFHLGGMKTSRKKQTSIIIY